MNETQKQALQKIVAIEDRNKHEQAERGNKYAGNSASVAEVLAAGVTQSDLQALARHGYIDYKLKDTVLASKTHGRAQLT